MNATTPRFDRSRLSGVDVAASGSGATPLILLHGIGGCADSFAAQLSGLSGSRQVIAWDAPGYGDSPALTCESALDDYATEVLDMVREMDSGPVHLLGVSWGGVIAVRTALRAPGSLRSLVLAGSSRGSGRTEASADAMWQRVEELASAGPAEFARARGKRLVAPQAAAEVGKAVVELMSRVRLPGYTGAARSMADTDHTAVLGDVTTPTLVVVGAEDVVTGPEESRRLANDIPGARMVSIPEAGHAANQERPAEFNNTVVRFLGEIEQQSGEAGERR